MAIEFVPAVCPKCGGELRVPNNVEAIKCMYCGADIMMSKQSYKGPKSENEIEKFLMLARRAAEAENYEEVYKYTTISLEIDPSIKEAIILKGFAAGMLLRVTEAKKYFEWGIGFESNDIYNDRFTESIKALTENERLHIAYTFIVRIITNLYLNVRSYIDEADNLKKLGWSDTREIKYNNLRDKGYELNIPRIYFILLYYRLLDGIKHSYAPENQKKYRKMLLLVIENTLFHKLEKYKRKEINMKEAICFSDLITYELSGTDLIGDTEFLRIIDDYKNRLLQ